MTAHTAGREIPDQWSNNASTIAAALAALRASSAPVPSAPVPSAPVPSAPVTDQPLPTRRARRERERAQARTGLFSRMLTVRAFRAHQSGDRKRSAPTSAVAALLEEAYVHGVLALHSRRLPGQRRPVEHLAIGPGAVFVVDVLDAKHASVELRARTDGSPEKDLVVDGCLATSAPIATARRVSALRSVLVDAGLDNVPVQGVLCLVDGLLPLGMTALVVDGVHVVRQSGLTAVVAAAGFLDEEHRQTLREYLAEQLPEHG